MSEGEEMESTSAEVSNATIGSGTSGSQTRSSMRKSSKDDTFVSASDLSSVSSVNETTRISASNSDSNSNSNSSSINTNGSNGVYADNSSSSSSYSAQSNTSSAPKIPVPSNLKSQKVCQENSSDSPSPEDIGNPVFATCSSTATSASSAKTVRRSESWSGARSASLDSNKEGSEAENNDDTTSVTSMNEHSLSESQPPDSYHTPSASLHNIVLKNNTEKVNNFLSDRKNLTSFKESPNTETVESILYQGHDTENNAILGEDKDHSADVLNEVKEINDHPQKPANEGKNEETPQEKEVEQETLEDASGTLTGDLTHSTESNTSKDSYGSVSKDLEIVKISKPPGVRIKPTKKKMWYQQIFSTSYKSRSGDFKKLFKELPGKERLLVDYSCALQKEILVQGRMYVSQGFLSFHANIFGWETQTSIKLKEITSITKEKTALVIPNAVQVMTEGGDKYFFTSFVTRDSTYMMLFKLWQSALLEDVSCRQSSPRHQILEAHASFHSPNRQTNKSMPSREIQRLIHSCYGEELIITSEDETEDILSCKSSPIIGDTTDVSNLLPVCRFDDSKSIVIDQQVCASDIGPALAVGGNLGSTIVTSKVLGKQSNDLQSLETVAAITLVPSDLSDSSDSEDDFQPSQGILSVEEEPEVFEIPVCPVLHSEGKETLNAVFPCNIDQLFTMLFTNSKFYLDLHTARKTFDINQSPWEIGPDGNKKTRQVSMTVSLSAVMGPKHSQVTETQVMLPVSKPGLFYAIDSESVNAGIPYADTFYVTVHYCLSRVSANESKLIVVNQVKYKKSVWGITKSIIEKNCWAGIEEFYAHLERALKEECTKMSLGASPMPSPKHVGGTVPRRRPPRKKGKAPDVPVGIPPLVARNSLRNGNFICYGSIPSTNMGVPASTISHSHEGSQTVAEGSFVLKIVLSVLACLLLLNGFLYFKLTRLETSTTTPLMFPPQAFSFPGELPQNHQDWLLLLQKQEALHRIELQKWHEILMSALKILHQAESDLEALKFHIGSYSGGKYAADSAEVLKQESAIAETTTSLVPESLKDDNYNLKNDETVSETNEPINSDQNFDHISQTGDKDNADG